MKILKIIPYSTYLLALIILNCANRGNPMGGPKDETPPQILKSIPENFSTQFKSKEIIIYFDEYIKIKDLQKQLIISPPMENAPLITPLGGASKYIHIKIKDTLKANTTYAFNFGNSIVDNNEENPFPYYRYVFSTGNHIDSLSVKGKIFDALNPIPDTFVNIGLYAVDANFTDSIVFKKPPTYITNTLDSITHFNIENLKAGKYLLVAIKDADRDFMFQPLKDKIGFYNTIINVPTDSSYILTLFKETPDFKTERPFLNAQQQIGFGYMGEGETMKIKLRSKVPSDFKSRIVKSESTDTLYYWYNTNAKIDSLAFEVSKNTYVKNYSVKIKKQKLDTLRLNYITAKDLETPFKVSANIPFEKFDKLKFTLMDKDSIPVTYKTEYDSLQNTYNFKYTRIQDNVYYITILPNAFTDFLVGVNKDTVKLVERTRKESDYGYVRFDFDNVKLPIIIQLTNDKGDVKYEKQVSKNEPVDFLNVEAGKYEIRVIHDINGNGKFDTGNFLKHQQPEPVSFFKMLDDVRPDWGNEQTLFFSE